MQDYAALEHVIVSSSGGGYRGFIDDNSRTTQSVSTREYLGSVLQPGTADTADDRPGLYLAGQVPGTLQRYAGVDDVAV